jgi:leucyl-tRNA synthetase
LWGATFMVLAPEHDLVESLTSDEQRRSVEEYRAATARRSELERMETARDKTGVFTGGSAINPVNGERIPVWIADYVLLSYGSGAIMAVPAHDQRDFEFARAMDLPIVPVIQPPGREPLDGATMTESYVGPGVMVNSGPIDGIETTDAKGRLNPSISATIDWLEENNVGTEAVNYKVRDWLISRQRYWGAPIPMIYKADGTIEQVDDLPVILPEGLPREGAASPLTTYEPFLDTVDSEGEPARRETDTQDTFVCSSWYQLRYLSPAYPEGPFDPEEAAYWLPVDVYNGGAEHAVMHLMYTRFFTKAMRDLGLYDDTAAAMKEHGRDPEGLFDEPMLVLRNQGQILGEDSQRMSKSRGNVVNPDDLVDRYGADTVRTYLMFAFDWEKGGPWDPHGIAGARRFIEDVWKLGTADYEATDVIDGASEALLRAVHQTIQKVDHDMLGFKWNTAVAKLMELRNTMLAALRLGDVNAEAWDEAVTTMLLLLAPIAPHITEELWHLRGNDESIHLRSWPEADAAIAAEDMVTLVVQVNGKVRDRLQVTPDIDEDAATEAALGAERVQPYLAEGEVRKVIARPPGLVNIVIG